MPDPLANRAVAVARDAVLLALAAPVAADRGRAHAGRGPREVDPADRVPTVRGPEGRGPTVLDPVVRDRPGPIAADRLVDPSSS